MGFLSFDRKNTAKQLELSDDVARAIAARPLPSVPAALATPNRLETISPMISPMTFPTRPSMKTQASGRSKRS